MKYLLIIAFISIFIGCEKKQDKVVEVSNKNTLQIESIKPAPTNPNSLEYEEYYIENIILNGSNQNLGFATKTMDAGIAHKMDAKNIARYVMLLRGKKSSDDIKAKKSAIFYTSNCGGCHGNDGKGLHGTFPDLTRPQLLGIMKKNKLYDGDIFD